MTATMTLTAASTLPTVQPAPGLLPPGRESRHLHLVPDTQQMLAVDFRAASHDPDFGPQPSATVDLPDPAVWSRRMLLGLMETMNGLRPPTQIERCLPLELRERIRRAHAIAIRRGTRPAGPSRVLRVRVRAEVQGVAEVSAVVQDRGRVRAIAMRLTGYDGRWLVTVLEIG